VNHFRNTFDQVLLRPEVLACYHKDRLIVPDRVGERRIMGPGGDTDVNLTLTVPSLNDCRYRILSYEQPIELYPGKSRTVEEPARIITIREEAQFVAEVGGILSSPRVKNILTSLLAQAVEA
jgi:hypothetical protein